VNQFEYIPIMVEQQHNELLNQSTQSRLLNNAFSTKKPNNHGRSKFLVMLRKELLYLRYTIEDYVNERREFRPGMSEQRNSEGCA
jgi:hypothetical protein